MLSRRNLLSAMMLTAAGLTVPRRQPVAAVADHDRFAARAFAARDQAVASGDQPYGAVVVKDGRIIGFGPSRVVVNLDPTGHAEMEALRQAGRTLGSADLGGCVMYSSSPPCRMCETAAYWANIERVYSGRPAQDRGKPGYGC